jgi:hypothetical protein
MAARSGTGVGIGIVQRAENTLRLHTKDFMWFFLSELISGKAFKLTTDQVCLSNLGFF